MLDSGPLGCRPDTPTKPPPILTAPAVVLKVHGRGQINACVRYLTAHTAFPHHDRARETERTTARTPATPDTGTP
ncbi:hypothetical protein ACSNOI_13280 [Actinomadura kijaniata]|uniref:hypothetical protein n=1 Tax=Actinomadura kijaniata TaxID=46161 RepID=UPI003F1BC0C2